MNNSYQAYANLLANYSLSIKKGDRLLVKTTYLAEPLLQELSKAVYKAGGVVDFMLSFNEQDKIFIENAEEGQLDHVSPMHDFAMRNYEAYLYIMAPFNLNESIKGSKEKSNRIKQAKKEASKIYSERTATRDLKRSLCVFPNLAMAQKAGKSLSDYQDFVFNACKLNEDDPISSWLDVRKHQQEIVDVLSKATKINYRNNNGVYWNGDVKNVTLEVKDGEVQSWKAEQGQSILDAVMEVDGARRFGEAAIGTNYNITEITKNTLFDEKMGGTVHMALGQSYLQAGGKNQSAVHWDLICNMKEGGEILADDEVVYKDGKFLFLAQ